MDTKERAAPSPGLFVSQDDKARTSTSTLSASQSTSDDGSGQDNKEEQQSSTQVVLATSPSEKQTTTAVNAMSDVEAQKSKSYAHVAPSRWRHLRITIITVYHSLFSIIFIANITAAIVLLVTRAKDPKPPLNHFATAAAANITVAILIRQDYVINILYGTCRLMPLSMPLAIRRHVAHIYELGGVHSGSATCSVIWFLVLTVYLTIEFVKGTLRDPVVLALNYALVVLLLAIVVTALPRFRFLYHNMFENVHRFAGWSSLGIFWVELGFFIKSSTGASGAALGLEFVKLPAFWFLVIASLHAIYPWVLLHKVYVTPEKLSNHAIRLHHKENVAKFRGLAISDAPLQEWHSFASIPARDGNGGSMIISNAGDWTRKTIDNPRPYYYVRGIPAQGVLTMSTIFRRVVIVTTGSGIGPCLGVMSDLPKCSCRVIWSTPAPEATFGKQIVDDVRQVDANAIIHDTRALGRPDLIQMTYDLCMEFDAEAVFCISNKRVTEKVLYGLRSRGVYAYGPIWDS